MAVEYKWLAYPSKHVLVQSNRPSCWSDTDSQLQDTLRIEEEIAQLRKRMELAVMQEKSLTSEIVVRISSMLDVKINEYMNIHGKRAKG